MQINRFLKSILKKEAKDKKENLKEKYDEIIIKKNRVNNENDDNLALEDIKNRENAIYKIENETKIPLTNERNKNI